MKPLELVSVNKDKEAEDNYKKAREDEQRKAEEDEVRDRIEKAKNKRKRNAKLDGKSIAEAEDNPDEALDWVARARKYVGGGAVALGHLFLGYQHRNAIASKVLSNLDELEQETSNAAKKKAKIDANYSEADLSGLKVAHDVRDFDFGDERILTLKDSTILDSEGGWFFFFFCFFLKSLPFLVRERR